MLPILRVRVPVDPSDPCARGPFVPSYLDPNPGAFASPSPFTSAHAAAHPTPRRNMINFHAGPAVGSVVGVIDWERCHWARRVLPAVVCEAQAFRDVYVRALSEARVLRVVQNTQHKARWRFTEVAGLDWEGADAMHTHPLADQAADRAAAA
ncbi:hypothetical protein GGX14DRAFT_365953 [Mycena pura]|uniref:Uncharacterized protein n=1 Tax=Mycena pura TaxID=153505 RepID=A0AAD6YG22_9AGAR|nr:hypothetical protein GGX14DRAFT_365953 [Mycena pura]